MRELTEECGLIPGENFQLKEMSGYSGAPAVQGQEDTLFLATGCVEAPHRIKLDFNERIKQIRVGLNELPKVASESSDGFLKASVFQAIMLGVFSASMFPSLKS